MNILVADDDVLSRTLLEETLVERGYTVTACPDGQGAWDVLQQPTAPEIAILDWEMPILSGPEVCTLVRERGLKQQPYLFLLTFREGMSNLVAGLDSGANDYLTKPFKEEELVARLRVAQRVVDLQRGLAERVAELEQALATVRTLRALLPICAWCRRVRSDENYWQQVEEYITEQTGTRFTHGICPDCLVEQTKSLRPPV